MFAPKVSALSSLLGLRSSHSARGLGASIQPLAAGVLFSSVASLMGSPGQANYAAANATLDGRAAGLQACGVSGVSIQWGAWAGGGMALKDPGIASRMERAGMGLLTVEEGLGALAAVLGGLGSPVSGGLGLGGPRLWRAEMGAASVAWPRLLGQMKAPLPDVYADLASSESSAAAASAGPILALAPPSSLGPSAEAPSRRAPSPASSLPAASRAERLASAVATVSGVVRGVLGAEIGHDEPLMDAGLDSLGAVELRNALEGQLGLSLPVTAIFDYPSVNALAGFLADQLRVGSEAAAEAEAEAELEYPAARSLAPGPSLGPDSFLGAPSRGSVAILCADGFASPGPLDRALSLDGIRTVPLERWDREGVRAWLGSEARDFGGFMAGAELFDGALFGVQHAEAVLMDPQQRLLLRYAWEALASAGSSVSAVSAGGFSGGGSAGAALLGGLVGAFVGVSSSDYGRLANSHASGLSAWASTGSALSVTSGRLSYTFGLRGPSMTIDTACSSSLVATHLAHVALGRGDAQAAVSSGVNLTLDPATGGSFARAGMLAADGRCKALDATADGYVRGEAVAVLVLGLTGPPATPSSSSSGPAALISGSAVNQDGRSSTLTAPNGPAQQECLREALRSAGAPAGRVAVLQLHGTGTPLGDPIEVGAAQAVLLAAGRRSGPGPRRAALALAAAKSMAGHTEPAAGALGLVQLALEMAHGTRAPIHHLVAISPHVVSTLRSQGLAVSRDDDGGGGGAPLASAVAARATSPLVSPLGASEPALGGVSAFAFQGTNAHVVSESFVGAPIGSRSRAQAGALRPSRVWAAAAGHALALRAVAGPLTPAYAGGGLAVALLEALLSSVPGSHAGLWDHAVAGRPVVPGAAFLEVGSASGRALVSHLEAGGPAPALTGVSIPQACLLPSAGSPSGRCVSLRVEVSPGGRFEVTSFVPGVGVSGRGRSVHATGGLELFACGREASSTSSASSASPLAPAGPRFRRLGGAGASFASLRVCEAEGWPSSGFWAPPSALDSSMHLGAGVGMVGAVPGGGMRVPAGAEAFWSRSAFQGSTARASASASASASAGARPGAGPGATATFSSHLLLDGSAGIASTELRNLEARPVAPPRAPADTGRSGAPPSASSALPIYDLQWLAAASSLAPSVRSGTLPLLRAPSVALSFGCGRPSLPSPVVGGSGPSISLGGPGSAEAAFGAAADVLQSLGLFPPAPSGVPGLVPSLRLDTLHAHVCWPEVVPSAFGAGGHSPDAPSLLQGLLRTAAQELPSVASSSFDGDARALCGGPPSPLAAASLSRLSSRGGVLASARLRPSTAGAPGCGCGPLSLAPSPRGSFASLRAVPHAPSASPLPAGAVEVAVSAVGLNFRDVLNILGMYPGDPGPPGADCSGVVVRIGAGARLPVGSAVFGLAPGALGTRVVVGALGALQAKPPSLSFEQAAALPTICCTVELALLQAACVSAGERVLVHGAAGGVGLAALNLLASAEVGCLSLATAGSPRKRSLVRSLGVHSVGSSRDTSFSELVAVATRGGGVGAVLNSLTSAGMVSASLSVLGPRGRFAEIAKRDIFGSGRVACERPDVRYSLVALDFLPPRGMERAMGRLARALAGGALSPLPTVGHELASAASALRQMAAARHVGKVVVRALPGGARGAPPSGASASASGSGGVSLVTGGLGALGSMVALWLAQRPAGSGARVSLAGRSGRGGVASSSGDGLVAMASLGLVTAVVSLVRCDASCSSEAAAACCRESLGSPVEALFHAGGMLQDGTLGAPFATLACLRSLARSWQPPRFLWSRSSVPQCPPLLALLPWPAFSAFLALLPP